MNQPPDSCSSQHEKLAVMAENIEWIKKSIEDMHKQNLATRMTALEIKQKTHAKAIGYGITVLTGIFLSLAKIAYSMSQ